MNLKNITSLYRAALEVDSLQGMVDLAHKLSGYPILVADSIHNILAMSRDLTERFGADARWQTLLEQNYLPSPPDSASAPYQMPLPSQLEQPQPVHVNHCVLPDGAISIMCDLRDRDHIVLKLAVMRVPKDQKTGEFAQALAEGCLLLYYRLLRGAGSPASSGRGQYILSLIHGQAPSASVNAQWLGIGPPYVLMVFPKIPEGVVALSFSRMAEELEHAFGYGIKTVTEEEQLTILLHAPDRYEEFIWQADKILRMYQRPAGVSQPFQNMMNLRSSFEQAQIQLQAAMDFQGFCRCATEEEFTLFQMFRSLVAQDSREHYLHPDAKLLAEMDEKHGTHYLETVFSWLYYEKNAAQAAKHIYVHRNTLDNRMGKIAGMVQAHWKNSGYCIRMLYSAWFLLRRQGLLRDGLLR